MRFKTLKSKMILMIYFIIVIMGLILTGIVVFFSNLNQKNIILENNAGNAESINKSFNVILSEIENTSTFLLLNDELQTSLKAFLEDGDKKTTEYQIQSNKMANTLLVLSDYINGIVIYDTEGHPLSVFSNDSKWTTINELEGRVGNYFELSVLTKGRPVWFMTESYSDEIYFSDSKDRLCLFRSIIDHNTGDVIGVLCIDAGIASLEEAIFGKTSAIDSSGFFFLNDLGDMLLCSDKDLAGELVGSKAHQMDEDSKLVTIEGMELVISRNHIRETTWTAYAYRDLVQRGSRLAPTVIYSIYVIIAFVLFLLPSLIFLSTTITAPVNRIVEGMKAFEAGDFNVRIENESRDELGDISRTFNTMVEQIHELIEETYVLQLKETEAELNLLQAQINPHFLYNMLDTIQWKAIEEGQEEIAEMSRNLGKMFRLSLNRGQQYCTVDDEKAIIENYLKLQKIRFEDRLNYEIDFEVHYKKIPKLLVQPLVENAVLHGVSMSDKACRIYVACKAVEDGCIQFIVRDDGRGMDPDVAAMVNKRHFKESYRGYGLKNVLERLEIYYKRNYELVVTGDSGIGTEIRMTLKPEV